MLVGATTIHLSSVTLGRLTMKCPHRINREDVYPENNRGGTDEIYASDPEQSIWENEPNLHILGLSMDSVGQFERIKVINMQMHAYL